MIGQVVLGRYEVFAFVHEVGVSRVFLALDTIENRTVVLQLLQEKLQQEPRFAEIFKRETELLDRFRHPHATSLLEASFNCPQGPCLVLENAKGKPLLELMQGERYPPLQVGKWLGQIGSALYDAYTLGILHRDLNPSNIILINAAEETETIKVKNFGLSQLTVAPHLTLEDFKGAVRTPTAMAEFMCPEQALGEEMDHRGDLYSLGVILYQLLTGVHPLANCTTAEEYREAHAQMPPRSFKAVGAEDVPAAIQELVLRCLYKYNAWRPFDAADLVRRYERALGEEIAVQPAGFTEGAAPLSPSGVFRTLPPGALLYRLEGWMPEQIAVIKLQGFVKSVDGRITESIPGLVRIRLLHPDQPPPVKTKSAIFKLLSKSTPPEQPRRFLELEVHMEKKDPARPNLLDIALVCYSQGENLVANSEIGKHCDKLCKEICSFLMAKPIEV